MTGQHIPKVNTGILAGEAVLFENRMQGILECTAVPTPHGARRVGEFDINAFLRDAEFGVD